MSCISHLALISKNVTRPISDKNKYGMNPVPYGFPIKYKMDIIIHEIELMAAIQRRFLNDPLLFIKIPRIPITVNVDPHAISLPKPAITRKVTDVENVSAHGLRTTVPHARAVNANSYSIFFVISSLLYHFILFGYVCCAI